MRSRAFNSSFAAICLAGLVAAAIDACYFSITAIAHGRSPVMVLQGIASFWLGRGSFSLGAASALLGAATHVGLATIMAAGFAGIGQRLSFVRAFPLAAGAIYGIGLYVVMYLAVMPLRWPQLYPRWDGWRSIADILVHVVIGLCFGFMLFRSSRRAFEPLRAG